jgi:hypothetical protein
MKLTIDVTLLDHPMLKNYEPLPAHSFSVEVDLTPADQLLTVLTNVHSNPSARDISVSCLEADINTNPVVIHRRSNWS